MHFVRIACSAEERVLSRRIYFEVFSIDNRHLGSSSRGIQHGDGDTLRYDAVTKYIRDRMSRRNQVVSATDIDNFLEAIKDEVHINLADPDIVDREVASLLEEKAKFTFLGLGICLSGNRVVFSGSWPASSIIWQVPRHVRKRSVLSRTW